MKSISLVLLCLIVSAFLIDLSVQFHSKNKAHSKNKNRFRNKLKSKSKNRLRLKLKHQKKLFADMKSQLKIRPNFHQGMDSEEVDTLRLKSEAAKLGIKDTEVQNSHDGLNDNQYQGGDHKTQDDFLVNPSDFKFELPDDLRKIEENRPIIKKRMRELPYEMEMNKIAMEMSDWLSVTSASFANTNTYPGLDEHFIHTNKNFTRVNDKYISPFNTNGVPSPVSFWFKQNLKYIYYFETKNCTNALGTIYLDEVMDARDLPRNYGCFSLIMRENNVSYKICAETNFIKRKWLCRLQDILNVEKSKICGGKKIGDDDDNKFKIKKIITPMVLIPLPSEKCNENWNYLRNGDDWQCKCIEGQNQSPLNLPPPEKAIKTAASPLFDYNIVPHEAEETSHDGLVKKGQNHRIYFRNGALRIYSEQLGKIVTLDGAGYYADEIVFHTPSEHKINGKKYDMEMKIIHRAKTVGDYSKMLTLSFLFKRKPGAYNKFLDKLDFYNLPNPYETFQELKEDIFIPNIFLDEDIEGSGEMVPFSFFSYDGSVTEPPCNENTLVYVAAEPINVSYSTLELFREALKKPDMMTLDGRIINTSKNLAMSNRRRVQKQNGRAIFFYDKSIDCPFFYKHKKDKAVDHGHYERVTRNAVQYYFVDGEKPSMLPGAYVVTDREALGHMDKYERELQEYMDDEEMKEAQNHRK